MKRAWIIDLVATLVSAAIVAAVIAVAGGPTWASIGFGLVYYLLRPTNAQRAALRRGDR
jgi:hypothetical protein